MLDKIGYVNDLKLDEFKEHLVANFDKLFELYINPTSASCAGVSDDCLRAIYDATKFYDGEVWNYKFKDFDDWAYVNNCVKNYSSAPKAEQYAEWLDIKFKYIRKAISHYTELGGRLEIVYETGRFVIIQYASNRFIGIPKDFVVFERVKSYDTVEAGKIHALISGVDPNELIGGVSAPFEKGALALPQTAHLGGLKSEREQLLEDLQKAEAAAKEAYEAQRREMERALSELREKQEKALSLMREQVEGMKDKIFLLEMDIFALRSLFGETFTLVQLNKGKTSNNPLVLYQKFRFLDEEFALLAAQQFQHFTGEHGTTVEIFKNPIVQERFLPSEKCITFFRTSKDQKYYTFDADNDGLKAIEYYHGSQVGMLIRNGENVWLSFIDEEVFVDDNLFESEATWQEKQRELGDDLDRVDAKNDVIVKGVTKLRDPIVRKGFSRVMLFFILEGLIKSTNIFSELKGVNIRVPSNKVVFSAADNQIGNSRYPSFREFFESWREHRADLRAGDHILVIQRGRATYFSVAWKNEQHRSRGYDNRARDAEDISTGVHEISVIDEIPEYEEWLVDRKPYKVNEVTGEVTYYRREACKEDFGVNPNVHYAPRFKFFVSCKRDPYIPWDRTAKRINNVNLEVYVDDFCPVEYVNSNYVLSWMDQKNVGEWKSRDMNYTYLVENVFHKLMKFVREREECELLRIREFIPSFTNTPEQLDDVLAWKIEHKVKNFNTYQAKRFAKWYIQKEGL